VRRRRTGDLFNIIFVLGMAAAAASTGLPLPALAEAAPAASMTGEWASTGCWINYEKEGRGRSLDQWPPLVWKCTAEKLKAALQAVAGPTNRFPPAA
jgi:hypothetical protein